MEITDIKTLKDCFAFLEEKFINNNEFKECEEKEALAFSHHTVGMWIRNNFGFWADCGKSPEERSELVKWFNNRGIYHPDDMSGIILTSFHRHLNDKKIKLKKQINKYRNHWKKINPNINIGKI